MSTLFPRFPSGDFAPLFRLLDDYDVHRSTSSQPSRHANGSPAPSHQIRAAFQPRFDVREEQGAYLLNGELPGIDQKDVSIEFVDPQTLVIKGRTERQYESSSPGAAAIEGASTGKQPQITESGEGENGQHQYHKATVEDESGESTTTAATDGEGQATPSTTTADHEQQIVSQSRKPAEPKYRFWVSERSVGEFHRTFSFPGRVDQDAVKASLRNGILSVVIPKAVAKEGRKIAIE
ncbi:hypothetical protein MMC19_006996 [Ptychographa xylographoides]|nr:hypothetical protein [Ptychographa xylographoides]